MERKIYPFFRESYHEHADIGAIGHGNYDRLDLLALSVHGVAAADVDQPTFIYCFQRC